MEGRPRRSLLLCPWHSADTRIASATPARRAGANSQTRSDKPAFRIQPPLHLLFPPTLGGTRTPLSKQLLRRIASHLRRKVKHKRQATFSDDSGPIRNLCRARSAQYSGEKPHQKLRQIKASIDHILEGHEPRHYDFRHHHLSSHYVISLVVSIIPTSPSLAQLNLNHGNDTNGTSSCSGFHLSQICASIETIDIRTAFFNRILLQEVHMRQAVGYADESGRVCKLPDALNGFQQVLRTLFITLSAWFIENGFELAPHDLCLYVNHDAMY
ncbi:DNA-directed DNA polymerase [Synchytrium endobioticum]|uniref:DNA-directed DNA polymerase n=2 Tax=Synchytrium endobioticum TaxID=286115 RepID=A0A507DBR8_9FUNG|nr:DNA-directed DNA polymerase [Synchytrium endobioticum]